MKYPFHLVDVFSSTPFGGNQLAILPDATGISTEGMQKIARGVQLSLNRPSDPAEERFRELLSSAYLHRLAQELNFAGHPTIGTACALAMKQHAQTVDPIRLILEENIGPVMVDARSAKRRVSRHLDVVR